MEVSSYRKLKGGSGGPWLQEPTHRRNQPASQRNAQRNPPVGRNRTYTETSFCKRPFLIRATHRQNQTAKEGPMRKPSVGRRRPYTKASFCKPPLLVGTSLRNRPASRPGIHRRNQPASLPRKCPAESASQPRRCPAESASQPRTCPAESASQPRRCPAEPASKKNRRLAAETLRPSCVQNRRLADFSLGPELQDLYRFCRSQVSGNSAASLNLSQPPARKAFRVAQLLLVAPSWWFEAKGKLKVGSAAERLHLGRKRNNWSLGARLP